MPITLTFELNDKDLEHFNAAAERARNAAEGKSGEDIIAAATGVLENAQKAGVPEFILHRLLRLDDMIAMVRDQGWSLPDADRQRVIDTLSYFADPNDIIPDATGPLGFFDDAVMVELAVHQLTHEIDAYDEFCEYREREAKRRGVDPSTLGRAEWMDGRREELFERMHNRRERDFGTGYGRSSGYADRRQSYVRAWRPGSFRVG